MRAAEGRQTGVRADDPRHNDSHRIAHTRKLGASCTILRTRGFGVLQGSEDRLHTDGKDRSMHNAAPLHPGSSERCCKQEEPRELQISKHSSTLRNTIINTQTMKHDTLPDARTQVRR